jgi:hypothetical protein
MVPIVSSAFFQPAPAVVMVLLIACTNLANLSLAQGTSRAHETAAHCGVRLWE